MKKYTQYIFLGLLLGLTFCQDPLQEKLYDSQQLTDFYQNENQGQLALQGVYAVLWTEYIYKDAGWTRLGDNPGETVQAYPRQDEYDLFAWSKSSSQFEQVWTGAYLGINRANTLIDRLEMADIPDEAKAKIVGQAKFLRALLYFDLVQVFGGVPIHTAATLDVSEVAKPRNTAEEVYAQIITDLTDAETLLSPFDPADHAAGKATSGAAKALLAKVYLQNRDWPNAAAKAKEVIDMGVYGLFPDYKDIWDPAHANGSEQIFSIQHGNGGDNTSNLGEHMVWEFGPASTSLPDGTRIEFAHDQTVIGQNTQVEPTYFASVPNTYRKWWSMRDRMPYYYVVGQPELIEDTVQLEAPFIIKFHRPDFSTGNLQTGVRLTLLRYSDVLLTYAEALNEANGGPTAEAYDAINQVRQRARAVGTPNEQPESIYPDLSGMNQQQFRMAVLDERAQEFIGEGHRRWDLLRHDMLLDVARASGVANVDETDVLYPLPDVQTGRNPLLQQNPGYQ